MAADDTGRETGGSTGRLLARARAGDDRALSRLLRRQGDVLRHWARGRLPRWARALNDTADLVQEALLHTFRRIDRFEDRGKGALRAYLRQAVLNRIRNEVRRVRSHPVAPLDEGLSAVARTPSPFDSALSAEHEQRYKLALQTLTDDERELVVGRMELGYSYDQLALVSGRATSEAARVAVRRAVTKLARRMGDVV